VIPEPVIYRLAIPAAETVSRAIEGYRRDPRCRGAEPNYLGEGGDVVPMDPYFFDCVPKIVLILLIVVCVRVVGTGVWAGRVQ
jgi:hypothetical protein